MRCLDMTTVIPRKVGCTENRFPPHLHVTLRWTGTCIKQRLSRYTDMAKTGMFGLDLSSITRTKQKPQETRDTHPEPIPLSKLSHHHNGLHPGIDPGDPGHSHYGRRWRLLVVPGRSPRSSYQFNRLSEPCIPESSGTEAKSGEKRNDFGTPRVLRTYQLRGNAEICHRAYIAKAKAEAALKQVQGKEGLKAAEEKTSG